MLAGACKLCWPEPASCAGRSLQAVLAGAYKPCWTEPTSCAGRSLFRRSVDSFLAFGHSVDSFLAFGCILSASAACLGSAASLEDREGLIFSAIDRSC